MVAPSKPITDPAAGKPPRPKRWIPLSLKVFVAVLVLLAGIRALIPAWNQSTVEHFLRHAHEGDFGACRNMLEDAPYTHGLLLDERALKLAAAERLFTEPTSIADAFRGRQRFRVHLAAFNDHSITVEWGRVRLGSAFWYYIPPGPNRIAKREPLDSSLDASSAEVSQQDIDEYPFGNSTEKPFDASSQ